ncbi:ABC transporter ATP-binding protein [Streptomyces pacificus]|uniref:ATP-binding cassette domain-containing protein n=1 Tax=Streptomyces pacificus TaxID=2705029 RepID=A0A6A0AQ05_9ACTN|nr:ABC transporter ATP-binding protein [Streptomyces pacificus]GFH34383.1 ATP-binding cassette domain-containing protein [Streptomyces pacificus]
MICFENVSVTYGGAGAAPTVAGVDLTVPEGELVLLVGPSGVGKSTLLGAVSGLVPHFTGGTLRGRVTVGGRDTRTHRPRELADLVGTVGQDPLAHFVTDTVEDELAYGMESLGLAPPVMRRRVEETLDLLGLAELRDRPLATLSGGQRQRVAIGSVLTPHPKVLVLDEPTSALDPAAAEEVLAVLQRLVHDLGTTVLMAEHRLERVVQYADRVVLLPAPGEPPVAGAPADVMAFSPVRPPVVALGRLAGWSPLPLSVRDARRRAGDLRTRLAGADAGAARRTGPAVHPKDAPWCAPGARDGSGARATPSAPATSPVSAPAPPPGGTDASGAGATGTGATGTDASPTGTGGTGTAAPGTAGTAGTAGTTGTASTTGTAAPGGPASRTPAAAPRGRRAAGKRGLSALFPWPGRGLPARDGAPDEETHDPTVLAQAARLGVRHGRVEALRRVDLVVRPGETVALMGRNGAGKSTLLGSLVGLVAPASGTVRVGGRTPHRTPPAELVRRVALVPQEPRDLLYADTVGAECAAADTDAGAAPGTCREIVSALLAGVADATHPRDLSEGQRLALALAIVLTARPPLLLLDEPTRGLDYAAKSRLVTVLRGLAAEGHGIVLATHDVELAAEIADRVVVLAGGEVVADGPTADVVVSSPAFAPQIAKVLAPQPWLTVAQVEAAL